MKSSFLYSRSKSGLRYCCLKGKDGKPFHSVSMPGLCYGTAAENTKSENDEKRKSRERGNGERKRRKKEEVEDRG